MDESDSATNAPRGAGQSPRNGATNPKTHHLSENATPIEVVARAELDAEVQLERARVRAQQIASDAQDLLTSLRCDAAESGRAAGERERLSRLEEATAEADEIASIYAQRVEAIHARGEATRASLAHQLAAIVLGLEGD